MATCKQLSEKYGETFHFYRTRSVALARRIAKETGCPVYRDKHGEWPFQILYWGRKAHRGERGCYVWKLRDELSLALAQTDLKAVSLYANFPDDENLLQESSEMSLSDIERAAIHYSKLKPIQQSITVTQYQRSGWVRQYAKMRAAGYCQLCGKKAPFMDKDGSPYLEVHHIIWLAHGGADTPENTVALCPNCHRKMHILYEQEDVEFLIEIAHNSGGS